MGRYQQYCGGMLLVLFRLFSTLEGYHQHLLRMFSTGGISSVLWRRFGTLERYQHYCGRMLLVLLRWFSTVKGYQQYFTGYHRLCGGIPSVLRRIFSTVGRYQQYCRGIPSASLRMVSTVGDINSTVEARHQSFLRVFSTVELIPKLLVVSPHSTEYSPGYMNIPLTVQNILLVT